MSVAGTQWDVRGVGGARQPEFTGREPEWRGGRASGSSAEPGSALGWWGGEPGLKARTQGTGVLPVFTDVLGAASVLYLLNTEKNMEGMCLAIF